MGENIHEGHRARLKNKFRKHGLDSFTDIEALELLLMYAIPRRNTNELAHALLDRFKSFHRVMEADISELEQVPGIGENAALLIRLTRDMSRRYQQSGCKRGTVIRSSAEAGAFLLPFFEYCREENSMLLCMDAAGRVIDCHHLAKGSPAAVGMAARELADLALRDKAARVILAHNHVSGIALPSRADVEATARVAAMLRMLDIELMDHIVVSEGDFVSMRDSGQRW
ncbi:MAG: DNA repair protein RadC [Ruminococcaceae bacterium]|nr:DNA repair protein RadC [Oscillospiraceae bacterium]